MEVNSNCINFELDGTEIMVKFTGNYSNIWVENLGPSDIKMSRTPGISDREDGVIKRPSGSSGGLQVTDSTIYILGSGAVNVMATNSAENPFKIANKGGGGNNLLPHSEGLAAYFDYSRNVSETGWTDIVGGLVINGDMILNDDSVTTPTDNIINLNLSNAFTIYALSKFIEDDNGWRSVIAEYDIAPQFNLCVNTKYIAIGTGSVYGRYVSSISALDYHICTLTYLKGSGILYIDGNYAYAYNAYHSPISSNYYLSNGNAYKMAAFFDNVAQSPDFISENTKYLAEKYGIKI